MGARVSRLYHKAALLYYDARAHRSGRCGLLLGGLCDLGLVREVFAHAQGVEHLALLLPGIYLSLDTTSAGARLDGCLQGSLASEMVMRAQGRSLGCACSHAYAHEAR